MNEVIFLTYIEKTDTCWLWKKAKTTAGYGVFAENRKTQYAHQYAWKLWKSPTLPKVIRHKCRNRHCVNPDHIEGGTQLENNRDRERDGTDNKGERHGNSILTEENVIEMRRLRREGMSLEDLMKRYDCGGTCIQLALSGQTWSHIANPITEQEKKQLRHHKKGKLTEEDKTDIRRRYADGVTQTRLANDYGVTQTTIYRVVL